MKKKILSMAMALSMAVAGITPVMADAEIVVPGEVIYTQDFEGTVEEEMTKIISGGATFNVVDGALQISADAALGYNKFGPEYADAIVTADIKQTSGRGDGGAYLGIGLRAGRQSGGAYWSNAATYFDRIKLTDMAYDKAGTAYRDRLGIVKTKGADYSKFQSYDVISDAEIGVLNQSKRNFDDTFYKLEAAIVGTTMINTIKTMAGEVLDTVTATVSPVSETTGYTQLQVHGASYVVDNIEIREALKISSFTAAASSDSILVDNSADIVLNGGEISPAIARYEYDDTALTIDAENGTVTPLKEGTHTVKVYLDDTMSANSLSTTFTVNAVDVLKISIPGATIYSQDFEGEVEEAMTTAIGTSETSFGLEVATEDDGNKALQITGLSALGLNNFGPEYTDAVITADVKQTAANGDGIAYFGIGARTLYKSNGYGSNIGAYFDIYKCNDDYTYNKAGTAYRDRLVIATGRSANGGNLSSVYEISNGDDAETGKIGILNNNRSFNDYYTMEVAIAGSTMKNSLIDADGDVLESVSATITPTTDGVGTTTLRAHGASYLVDNIEIKEIAKIAAFTATADEAEEIGTAVDFALASGALNIDTEIARYEYDETALTIDAENGTVTPLKAGEHTVTVYLDDVMSENSLSTTFTVSAEEAVVLPTEPTVTLDKNIRWGSLLEDMVASEGDNTLTVDGEVVYGIKVTFNANDIATYTKADLTAGENTAEVTLPAQISGASDVVFYIISNADIDSVTLK